MIKTLLTRKKEGNSLQPLTEKEIQQKLYGAYHQGHSVLTEKVEEEAIDFPSKKNRLNLPFSLPWKDVLSMVLKSGRAFFDFSRQWGVKMISGWGMSIVIVAFLFLGIHALNVYRADAMKHPRAVAGAHSPRRELRHKKPVKPPEVKSEADTEARKKPPENPVPPVATQPPSSVLENAYVIQVCTYTREEDAQRLIEAMKKESLFAFIQPLQRANGKTFYPVFLGRFQSFRKAQTKLKEFREKVIAKDFPDSFVRAL